MSRGGWEKLFLIILVSIVFLLVLKALVAYSIISESEVQPEEVPKIKPEAESNSIISFISGRIWSQRRISKSLPSAALSIF